MASIIVAQFAIMHGPVNFVFHGFDNDDIEKTIVCWGALDVFYGGVLDVSVGCSRRKNMSPISLFSQIQKTLAKKNNLISYNIHYQNP